MTDLRCEFCESKEHDTEDCALLRRSKGVRLDPDTRQILWSICTAHDYWSSNRDATCMVCEQQLYRPDGSIVDVDIARNKLFAVLQG